MCNFNRKRKKMISLKNQDFYLLRLRVKLLRCVNKFNTCSTCKGEIVPVLLRQEIQK